MYEKYFQLRERPFALSPDPEYLYPSRVHQEALSYLRWNMGTGRFNEFMVSARQHARRAGLSVERWAFGTRPRENEWGQARRNAIRFGFLVNAFARLFV